MASLSFKIFEPSDDAFFGNIVGHSVRIIHSVKYSVRIFVASSSQPIHASQNIRTFCNLYSDKTLLWLTEQ